MEEVKRVLSEQRGNEIYRYHLAKTMIRSFGFQSWMFKSNVRGENGERIICRAQI